MADGELKEYRIKFPVMVTRPLHKGPGSIVEENYALVTVQGKNAKDALLRFEEKLQQLVQEPRA